MPLYEFTCENAARRSRSSSPPASTARGDCPECGSEIEKLVSRFASGGPRRGRRARADRAPAASREGDPGPVGPCTGIIDLPLRHMIAGMHAFR